MGVYALSAREHRLTEAVLHEFLHRKLENNTAT